MASPSARILRLQGRALLGRILAHIRPHARLIAAAGVVDLLGIPLVLLLPLPLKIAVDSVIGDQPLPGFLAPLVPPGLMASQFRLLLVAVALQVLVVLAIQLQRVASHVLHTRAGERLTLDLRARLFGHAQRLSLRYHDLHGSADSLFRVEYDAPALQHLLDGFLPFSATAVMLFAALAVTFRIDWQLAATALVALPLLGLVSRWRVGRLRSHYHGLKDLDVAALKVVQEMLGAVRVVKAFGREDSEQQRFVHRSRRAADARVEVAAAEASYSLLVNLVAGVGTAMVLLIGVRSVLAGRLSLGALLVVLTYLQQVYEPMKDISETIGNLQGSVAGAQRAFELLDQLPEVPQRPHARPRSRSSGALDFRDVSFSYDGVTPVLDRVSLEVPAGARVGIAGRTGAGKTTLISLLLRFFDPDDGQILLDGVDLREWRLADLRRQFALVLQEPVLFSTSVAENIHYGRPGASSRDVVEAARAAGAHDFITRLPDGYDTVVGERGMLLSGGERQRIGLARAFLKDAPILLLDEPTSSLDLETEAAILETLEHLTAGRTTLLITHRLTALRGCDALLHVVDRRVVASIAEVAG